MGKKIISVLCVLALVATVFAGCSSESSQKYSDEVCIIGYTESVEPFLQVDENGKATGFYADLWKDIFDDVKGDLESYVFEKVDEGYMLEEDGGFFNSDDDTEYSAALLMGAVKKNDGSFNEDYSFTEPIITNRIIAITKQDSSIKSFSDFDGAVVQTLSDDAAQAVENNSAITEKAKSVTTLDESDNALDNALSSLDSGKSDVLIVDEFTFNKSDKQESYTVLENELDKIEYVIACKKNSDWKNSINEAIREMKSEKYSDGDTFTPLVEKYFGYNASSFNYVSEGDDEE